VNSDSAAHRMSWC